MKSVIIRPQSELLKKHVQYFLFFKKTDGTPLKYTTFPNNNLCLALYKENRIDYDNHAGQNNCIITPGNKNFTSRLYGFHKTPFTADIHSCLDQICIIFYPSALRAFTHESYADLMHSYDVFDAFAAKEDFISEQLFEEDDFSKRAGKLEQLLLKNLNEGIPDKLKEALHLVSRHGTNNPTVEMLARQLGTSTPTLFRLFKNHLGQNPKTYLKTLQFRNALNEILKGQDSLTSIALMHQFYDQAHFINDFKSFSGYSPRQLLDKVTVQQNDLAWIYEKKEP